MVSKKESLENNKVIERISVLAVLTAILFGILQYIPKDKTYEIVIVETGLKVISIGFFEIILPLVIIYIVLIAASLSHGNLKKIIPKKWIGIIYDWVVLLFIISIIFVTLFLLILRFIAPISISSATGIIIILLIGGSIFFAWLGKKNWK